MIGRLKVKNHLKRWFFLDFWLDFLAEEAGFELAVGITLRTLSRRMT